MRPTHLLAVLVAVGLLLPACDGDATTTPTESSSATESPTATASPTPTTSPSGPAVLEQPAAWPAASVVFDTPEAAASDFVADALGVPPSLGDFQQGDARSGEIAVLFAGEGDASTPVERGLLSLRRLGAADGWFVTAAPNDIVTIDTPEPAAAVPAGTLTVQGQARGFEGNVVVTAFRAGDAGTVLDQQVTTAGASETPEPYTVTLDLGGASPGDTVTILVRGGTGHEADPGDFAALAVVIAG